MTDIALCFALLFGLAILGSARLRWCIGLTALQGVATGVVLLFVADGAPLTRRIGLFVAILALKGFVFPRLLLRAARVARVQYEVAPLFGNSGSMAIGIVILLASFWFSAHFVLPTWHADVSDLVLPTAFATSITGLLLIVTRRSALMQVVGYLVLENGVFTFGVALAQEEPLLIEMGILLDVFAAVLVMGVTIFHISREFDHINVDELATLKK